MNIEFEKIEVQNFKSIGEMISFDYREFKGLNFVYGKNLDMPNAKNGSGKTNLLIDALMFALFGKTLKKEANEAIESFRRTIVVDESSVRKNVEKMSKRGLV
jgi:DNA repair exonuclease SbcCD ATPase subunit